jgi:methylase of polypeptide subunit release factors
MMEIPARGRYRGCVTDKEQALSELLERLKAAGYQFITVTPATHARVLARLPDGPLGLRDIFGWSRPFAQGDLDPDWLALLQRGGVLETRGEQLHCTVRVSSLGPDLFLHSAFPTDADDAVFFGPDTYRFARFVAEHMAALPAPRRIIDMGAGSGAGGLAAARLAPAAQIVLVDANARALALARVNAAVAGIAAELVEADRVPDGADLVLANPPYMMDAHGRAYRQGGDLLGGQVALEWTRQALGALEPGGALLLYTGAAVSAGEMPLLDALAQAACEANAALVVEELDPDVFGEELEQPPYREVERIAAIGARITRS